MIGRTLALIFPLFTPWGVIPFHYLPWATRSHYKTQTDVLSICVKRAERCMWVWERLQESLYVLWDILTWNIYFIPAKQVYYMGSMKCKLETMHCIVYIFVWHVPFYVLTSLCSPHACSWHLNQYLACKSEEVITGPLCLFQKSSDSWLSTFQWIWRSIFHLQEGGGTRYGK